MKRPKLNYRFHNPNKNDDELIKVLLDVLIEANMKKAETAIMEGMKLLESQEQERANTQEKISQN
ncbi:MAG: hypothetical protein ACI4MS_02640 [Candidatus Coproplasma sp.]